MENTNIFNKKKSFLQEDILKVNTAATAVENNNLFILFLFNCLINLIVQISTETGAGLLHNYLKVLHDLKTFYIRKHCNISISEK